MVQLVDSDIRTRKVLAWKGVHALHFHGILLLAEARDFPQPERHQVDIASR